MDNTVDMLNMLNDNELQAIQSVARIFIEKPSTDRLYKPLTETQLIERIEASLAETEAGNYKKSEDFEKEICAEFGL